MTRHTDLAPLHERINQKMQCNARDARATSVGAGWAKMHTLPPLHCLAISTEPEAKRPRTVTVSDAQIPAPCSNSRTGLFFSLVTYREWSARVLQELLSECSPVHSIVDSGHLPVLSLNSNNWFGVSASLMYDGQRVPADVPRALRRRWRLRDLLASGRNMHASRTLYTLRGHSRAPFSVWLSSDFVVDGCEPARSLYIENLYPSRAEKLPWLTGGDLLHASAILFVLLPVQYLVVGEGPGLRSFEARVRAAGRGGYFYYDKFIMCSARPIDMVVNSDIDEYRTVAERDSAASQEFWMWSKAGWIDQLAGGGTQT